VPEAHLPGTECGLFGSQNHSAESVLVSTKSELSRKLQTPRSESELGSFLCMLSYYGNLDKQLHGYRGI